MGQIHVEADKGNLPTTLQNEPIQYLTMRKVAGFGLPLSVVDRPLGSGSRKVLHWSP